MSGDGDQLVWTMLHERKENHQAEHHNHYTSERQNCQTPQRTASSCKATTDRLGRGTPPHDQRGAVLLQCSILRQRLSSVGAPQRPRSGHRSRAVLIRPPGRVDGRAAHTGQICRHLARFQRRRVTNWPLNRRKWPTRGAGEGLRTATDCLGLLRTGSAIRGAVARADLRP